MQFESIAAQGGAHHIDPAAGAVAPPLYLSTTFERDADGEYRRGFVYSRSDNPNRRALEECLALLEGGTDAAAFASGSAATAAVFQALRPGDHIIAPDDCYHGTARLLREVFAPWGLQASFVDLSDADAAAAAVRPNTRLVWIETPSNPLLKIADIARIAEIAAHAGAWCVCDNTWASPMLQRPLSLGAHLSVHSTTKYLGGHEDVTGGAVIAGRGLDGDGDNALFRRIRLLQNLYGAVPAPFDCWLVMRGIRTLHLRMPAHCANAGQVARFLQDHPAIAAVHYPGLPEHPGHRIAAGQMSGFGGMLSCQVKGGKAAALAAAGKVKIFVRATSLGGTQSLIEHRASIEGPDTATPDDLLRLSIGLENADDLIGDLGAALG